VVIPSDQPAFVVQDVFGVDSHKPQSPPRQRTESQLGSPTTLELAELKKNTMVLIAFHLPVRLYIVSREEELWDAVRFACLCEWYLRKIWLWKVLPGYVAKPKC
jgi:hypothetical protein